jgi:signal peptidase II
MFSRMTPKAKTVLACVLLTVPLDQLTKWWISATIPRGGWIDVIEGFFRLTHARNPGAALGLFPSAPIWIFIALSVAALVLIASFYLKLPAGDRFSAFALGLILGGAIGNLIDRVRLGEVVDFLQFDLGLFIFPDWNVADASIVIGVGLLLLEVVALETEESVRADARERLEGG